MVEGLEKKLNVSMPDLESPGAKDFLLDLVRCFPSFPSFPSFLSFQPPSAPLGFAAKHVHAELAQPVSKST